MKTLTRKKVNEFIAKYKHGLLLLYFLIYLPWFGYLEENVTTHFHVIHVALDDKIPFCEYFIIFAKYRQAVAFVYIDRYKKDFGRLVKVLCFCKLLSIFDFKPLRLPIRFQKWSPSGCSIPIA